jgi:hypothetical protein
LRPDVGARKLARVATRRRSVVRSLRQFARLGTNALRVLDACGARRRSANALANAAAASAPATRGRCGAARFGVSVSEQRDGGRTERVELSERAGRCAHRE